MRSSVAEPAGNCQNQARQRSPDVVLIGTKPGYLMYFIHGELHKLFQGSAQLLHLVVVQTNS